MSDSNHLFYGTGIHSYLGKHFVRVKAIVFALLLLNEVALEANPTNGKVANGTATIASQGNTVSIIQSSPTAIINWQSFSIGSGETTSFLQPSSNSMILNRVLGGSISQLDGMLSANGRVFLVNQNGIVIGADGIINTAGFLASSRDISDHDFMNGNLHFTGSGEGGVANLGTISALGGDVILLGKTVENEGTITASGTAALVSADDVLLNQTNSKGTTITVKASALATADKTASAVTNGGMITATTAQLSAAQGNLFALAINNTGYVKARTLQHSGGHILLTSDSGTLSNSGTLDANADIAGRNGGTIFMKSRTGKIINTAAGQILAKNGKGGKGGQIETSGETVDLKGKILTGHGGEWTIDPLTLDTNTLSSTTLESQLDGGGNVTETASNTLTLSGDGSFIWTGSATLTLVNNGGGITIGDNITATQGSLVLSATGLINVTGNVSVSSFTLQGGNWVQNGGALPTFTASNNFSITGGTFLRVAGGNGANATPYQVTDIYGLQGMEGFLGSSFILNNNINAAGTATWNGNNGFVPLGNATTGFTAYFDGQNHSIDGLVIKQTGISDVGLFGRVSNASSVIKNVGLTNETVMGSTNIGGLIGTTSGATILNCYTTGAVSGTTQNVGGLIGNYNGNGTTSVQNSYSNASVTSPNQTGGLIGSQYGGTIENCYATGNVVNGTGGVNGGLIGTSFYGSLVNCYATGNVTGSGQLGGLAGANGSMINGCYATGNVSGTTGAIGGLVGLNYNIVENSHATGMVSGGTSNGVGGLVGSDTSGSPPPVIQNCYATGNVSGGSQVGGLVGYNTGLVSGSYATGSISATYQAGGLVGYNEALASNTAGSVVSSYATGNVTGSSESGGLIGYADGGGLAYSYSSGSVNGGSDVGGLVGYANSFTLVGCYATGNVTGSYSDIGGLVGYDNTSSVAASYASGNVDGPSVVGGLIGYNNSGSILDSHATGTVNGTTGSFEVGGLVGNNFSGSIIRSYATGGVIGGNDTGGLVGGNEGAISLCYATGDVSGANDVGGLVGINQSATSAGLVPLARTAGISNGSSALISNCFARGNVGGVSNVGGLLGDNESGCFVATTYATGQVMGQNHLGGLVGSNNLGSVQFSYWLQDPTLGVNAGLTGIGFEQNTMAPSNLGALPRTFAELQLASSYDSTWDFTPGTGIWGANEVDPSTGQPINDLLAFFQYQYPNAQPYVPPAPSSVISPILANILNQVTAQNLNGAIMIGATQVYFSFDPGSNQVFLTDDPNSITKGFGKEHENSIASGSSYRPADANSGKKTTLVLPGSAVIGMIQGQIPAATLPPGIVLSKLKIILSPGVQDALQKAAFPASK